MPLVAANFAPLPPLAHHGDEQLAHRGLQVEVPVYPSALPSPPLKRRRVSPDAGTTAPPVDPPFSTISLEKRTQKAKASIRGESKPSKRKGKGKAKAGPSTNVGRTSYSPAARGNNTSEENMEFMNAERLRDEDAYKWIGDSSKGRNKRSKGRLSAHAWRNDYLGVLPSGSAPIESSGSMAFYGTTQINDGADESKYSIDYDSLWYAERLSNLGIPSPPWMNKPEKPAESTSYSAIAPSPHAQGGRSTSSQSSIVAISDGSPKAESYYPSSMSPSPSPSTYSAANVAPSMAHQTRFIVDPSYDMSVQGSKLRSSREVNHDAYKRGRMKAVHTRMKHYSNPNMPSGMTSVFDIGMNSLYHTNNSSDDQMQPTDSYGADSNSAQPRLNDSVHVIGVGDLPIPGYNIEALDKPTLSNFRKFRLDSMGQPENHQTGVDRRAKYRVRPWPEAPPDAEPVLLYHPDELRAEPQVNQPPTSHTTDPVPFSSSAQHQGELHSFPGTSSFSLNPNSSAEPTTSLQWKPVVPIKGPLRLGFSPAPDPQPMPPAGNIASSSRPQPQYSVADSTAEDFHRSPIRSSSKPLRLGFSPPPEQLSSDRAADNSQGDQDSSSGNSQVDQSFHTNDNPQSSSTVAPSQGIVFYNNRHDMEHDRRSLSFPRSDSEFDELADDDSNGPSTRSSTVAHSTYDPSTSTLQRTFSITLSPVREHHKKRRSKVSNEQLVTLEDVYSRTGFPNTEQRMQLGSRLEMTERQVQIWFQNKRQRDREAGHEVIDEARFGYVKRTRHSSREAN